MTKLVRVLPDHRIFKFIMTIVYGISDAEVFMLQ